MPGTEAYVEFKAVIASPAPKRAYKLVPSMKSMKVYKKSHVLGLKVESEGFRAGFCFVSSGTRTGRAGALGHRSPFIKY